MDVKEKLAELLTEFYGCDPMYYDIDAVKVVRCKDCKHYKPQNKSAHWENRANYCGRIVTIKPQPYDFCSYGERKEGDGND